MTKKTTAPAAANENTDAEAVDRAPAPEPALVDLLRASLWPQEKKGKD